METPKVKWEMFLMDGEQVGELVASRVHSIHDLAYLASVEREYPFDWLVPVEHKEGVMCGEWVVLGFYYEVNDTEFMIRYRIEE